MDRLLCIALCAGLGIIGGFIVGLAFIDTYALTTWLFGAHISEVAPLIVERVTVPLGIVVGAVIGVMAK